MERSGRIERAENLFIWFFLYSVIGWLYEVFLEVAVYRWGFSNRGFLFGPYLPVYGFGAIIFLLSIYKIKKRKVYLGKFNITPLAVFVGCALIATLVELITSYGLDLVHQKLWDYSEYAFNFEGRIALNPSVRFGLGGVLFLYVVQPLFEKLTDKLTAPAKHALAALIGCMLGLDLLVKILL